MINSSQRIVVTNTVDRIVTLSVGGAVVEVRESTKPNVQVVTVGVQGPVGTVAENVLAMAAQAEAAAARAEALAVQNDADLTQFVNSLSNAIAYQSGVFST